MGTIITGAIVFGLAGTAAWRIYKDLKKDKCDGCGCGGCGH
jgi:hypothetical protein